MALSQRVWPTAPGGVAIAVPSRQCADQPASLLLHGRVAVEYADGGRVERVQQRVTARCTAIGPLTCTDGGRAFEPFTVAPDSVTCSRSVSYVRSSMTTPRRK